MNRSAVSQIDTNQIVDPSGLMKGSHSNTSVAFLLCTTRARSIPSNSNSVEHCCPFDASRTVSASSDPSGETKSTAVGEEAVPATDLTFDQTILLTLACQRAVDPTLGPQAGSLPCGCGDANRLHAPGG